MASSEKEERSMGDEALLEERLIHPASPDDSKGSWPSLPTIVGFVFLTIGSAMAVFRALVEEDGDLGAAVSFVALSFLDLIGLLHCLPMYRRAPPGSPRRENLMVAIWLLATMLFISFLQLLEFWFLCIGNSGGCFSHFLDDPS